MAGLLNNNAAVNNQPSLRAPYVLGWALSTSYGSFDAGVSCPHLAGKEVW